MKISARNVLPATVSSVTRGAVNAEVDLVLEGGDKLAAIITNGSVDYLGLKVGMRAYAILKASWVMVGKGLDPKKLSARNVLRGKVVRVREGAVNNEIVVKLGGGAEVAAIVTRESSQTLELAPGVDADIAFKANNVIVAVD